ALRSFKVSLKQQMNASLFLSLLCLILGLAVHPFFFAISGLTMAPFYPLAVAYISEITGPHKRKYLTFVIGAQSLFVILMHIGVGYLTDLCGLYYAFGTGIILLIFAILCLNTHPEVY
ncbi:MAG: MFS transporter, partial [Pseudobdellovibrio sp.]